MLFEDVPEMWLGGFEGMRSKYLSLFSLVEREGINELILWIVNTDFFEAPASSNGHNNYEGGLVEHSLEVYYNLMTLAKKNDNLPLDLNYQTLILVSLCHDLCKADFYKGSWKNQKRIGPDGKDVLDDRQKPIWDQVPYYAIDDQFPSGHGEKSVFILQRFLRLTEEEILAIRWHMGGFDDTARSYSGGLALTKAMQKYPLVALLHCADLIASLPDQKETKQVPGTLLSGSPGMEVK